MAASQTTEQLERETKRLKAVIAHMERQAMIELAKYKRLVHEHNHVKHELNSLKHELSTLKQRNTNGR